jgi:hypothetical protein
MADDKLVEIPKFKIDGFSLTMDFGATKPEWESAGRVLAKFHRASIFLIGDWHIAGVNAGFTRGDLYDEAMAITGLDRATLYNAVNLAKSVNPGVRRTDLSPSHHREVASLEPAQQEKMLEQAALNHWTRQELADRVQERIPEHATPTEAREVTGARILWHFAQTYRDMDIFSGVVTAIDALATSGKRTVFENIRDEYPKHIE